MITERPRLEQLVGPLSAAINSLVEREVRAFIASDEFADLWPQVNTRAQQALQRVLTGEGTGAVSVQGDQLVLDVDEVINAGEGAAGRARTDPRRERPDPRRPTGRSC